MTRRFTLVLGLLISCTLAAVPAHAQIIGLQGVYVPPPTAAQRASFGVAADLGFMAAHGPLGVWTAVGGEYQRQREGGPGRGRVSADLRFLPVHVQSRLVPFVGGSVSWNRSGGAQSEWTGTRTGFDALAGLLLLGNEKSSVALSVQERFGYVVGMPHALATEAGFRFPLMWMLGFGR